MKVSIKKILGVFVLAFVFTFTPRVVFASNTEYEKILNGDNKIIITDTALNADKKDLLHSYLSKFYFEDGSFLIVDSCNEDVSLCKISLNKVDFSYETRDISIEYKENFSENFSNILTDGYLLVTSTSLSDDSRLISESLNVFNTDEYSFQSNCNESNTKCTIQMYKSGNVYGSGLLEQHIVEIKKEEKFSDKFNDLLTDGVLKFNTIKPLTFDEKEFLLNGYLASLATDEYDVYIYDTNEDFSLGDIVLNNNKENFSETHTVKLEFKKTDEVVKNRLNTYIKKFDSLKTEDEYGWKSFQFDLIDLEMINYYATTKSKTFDYTKLNEMFNYSQTIKNIFDGLNYTFDYDCRMGYDEPFSSYAEGGLSIIYEGIYYGIVSNIGTSAKNILYIPSDTEKTAEAFIKAAEKKIKDYIPNLNIKITKGVSFEDYKFITDYAEYDGVSDHIKELIDVNKTVNNVFVVDFGNFKVDFLIVADSSKEVKPEFMTYDLDTNISITSTSSSIPLDTQVKVKKITSGAEYYQIVNLLDVKENDMYDIKLYSNAKNEYITKLDNGRFEVKIPVSKELKGKTLMVYYVDENNKISEYGVTPEDEEGFVRFTTDHFSIYTLAEKKDNAVIPSIPETFDSVTNYVSLCIISLIVLLGTSYYLKKIN